MNSYDWGIVERARAARQPKPSVASERRNVASPEQSRQVGVLVFVFGIALPLFTLIFEVASGFCAALSFDPIPTIWHMFLVASVPIANAWCFFALRLADFRHKKLLGWLNAFAIGVSFYYTLLFLPLAPFGVMALAAVGLGLIPLSPAISLIVTLIIRRKLTRVLTTETGAVFPGLWKGACVAVAMLLLVSMPHLVTFAAAKIAVTNREQSQAFRFIRMYGNRDELLRLCFHVDRPLAPLGLIDGFFSGLGFKYAMTEGIEPEQGRHLYYRVTGTPYDAVTPPQMRTVRGDSIATLATGEEFDFDQGGNVVAARIRGLDVEQTKTDITIDADTAIAYIEWTLVFRNDSRVPRESRAHIALPPGGVVSRLTLWVNEEEREAAYSGRHQTRSAYENIVKQRRDPVLVTTSGKDMVMLQCFPVPANGGIMRTKIGITTPLVLESSERMLLRLPYFIERNFGISDRNTHTISVDANAEMRMTHDNTNMHFRASGGSYTLQGTLPSGVLTHPASIQVLNRHGVASAWAQDYRSKTGEIIFQKVLEAKANAPACAVIVVDGSRHMQMYKERIANLILRLPDDLEMSVLIAGDEVTQLCDLQKQPRMNREQLAGWLRNSAFEGGCDNAPALEKAFEMASSRTNAAVVWLHAVQPVALSETKTLVENWKCADSPLLYDLQLEPGPHILARQLEELPCARPVPAFSDTENGLHSLTSILSGTAVTYHFQRSRVLSHPDIQRGKRASDHLVRLWANEEILRLSTSVQNADRTNAVLLATSYQLVTPVSGAVVLETEQQYKDAGLEPIDPDSAPTIVAVPEPETWALLLIGAMVLYFASARERRRA